MIVHWTKQNNPYKRTHDHNLSTITREEVQVRKNNMRTTLMIFKGPKDWPHNWN